MLTCSIASNGIPCSGHGVCLAGYCVCNYGYNGTDCSQLTIASASCPSGCSGHGACYLGSCFCATGWEGSTCANETASSCPLGCTGMVVYNDTTERRGLCSYGSCFCYPSWSGTGCEEVVSCNDRCAYNGVCAYGTCFCVAGWTGTDCDIPIANSTDITLIYEADLAYYLADLPCGGCNGHGICISESEGCACQPYYTGTYCSQFSGGLITTRCGNDCNEHGQCLFGTCACDLGYIGETCDTPAEVPCLNNCMSHGVCNWGHCICDNGWTGSDCGTVLACDYDCGTHGVCVFGICECTQYYSGEACNIMDSSISELSDAELSILTFVKDDRKSSSASHTTQSKKLLTSCDLDCGSGVCANGQCFCPSGWSGSRCSIRVPSTFLAHPLNHLGSSPLANAAINELDAGVSMGDTQGTLSSDGTPNAHASYPPLMVALFAFTLGVVVCAIVKWAIDARVASTHQHRLKRLAMAHSPSSVASLP
jgi:tenascin